MKSHLLIVIVTILSLPIFGKDSIEVRIQQAINDSDKIDILLSASNRLRFSNVDSSIYYAQRALKLSEQVDLKDRSISSLNNLGFLHLMSGDHKKALTEYKKGLKISLSQEDSMGIAIAYNNLGNYYSYRGFKDMALEYYILSLRIKERNGTKREIAVNYTNIGIIYDEQGKFEKALDYYLKALSIKNELNDKRGIALVSSNLGGLYYDQGKFKKAKNYYQSSLDIYQNTDDKRGLSEVLSPMAEILFRQGEIKIAFEYLERAHGMNDELKSYVGLNQTSLTYSYFFKSMGQQKKALHHAGMALSYAQQSGDMKAEIDSWMKLSKIHESMGNYKTALKAERTSTRMKDSLIHLENTRYIEKLQVEYEAELKDRKLLLQNKDIILLNKDKKIRLYLIIGLVVLFVLIFWVLYSRNKRLRQTKENLNKEVKLKNKELVSFTMQTVQKNEQLQELREKIKVELDDSNQFKRVDSFFNSIQNSDNDWDEFKLRFEQVDQEFSKRLKLQFPSLTNTDLRICTLIRLKLSSKEIANMLSITHDSVNTSRYRIRKKLLLTKEEDLTAFISLI
jgi:tetratricopeptide (TPR) repeat protein